MTSPVMKHRAPFTFAQQLYNEAMELEGYRYNLSLAIMKKLRAELFEQIGITSAARCIMEDHPKCVAITRNRRTVHIAFREKQVDVLLEEREPNKRLFPITHKWGKSYTTFFFGRYRDREQFAERIINRALVVLFKGE